MSSETSDSSRVAADISQSRSELQGANRALQKTTSTLNQLRDAGLISFRTMLQNFQSSGGTQRVVKNVAAFSRQEAQQLRSLGSVARSAATMFNLGSHGLSGTAAMDRQLIRLQQSGGLSVAQRENWRDESARIARTYGLQRADVDGGFATLLGGGLNFSAARKAADALGQTSAVTGTDSAILGQALLSGAGAFGVDLNQDGAALGLLQQMTVAGRMGGPGFERLAELLPQVGSSAADAGLSIAQTLALLSSLPNESQLSARIAASRPADFAPEAGAGVTTLGVRAGQIANAGMLFGGDLRANLESASGTKARVDASLGQAIERMARPLNQGLAQVGDYLLDNLSGEQMLAGAALAGVGAHYAGRGAGALFNRFVGPETLQNLAVGRVLQDAAGVTPVFVTNWPASSPDLSILGRGAGRLGAGTATRSLGRVAGRLAVGAILRAPPLALAALTSVLGGDTRQLTDVEQLAELDRDKRLTEPQRRYYRSYHRIRAELNLKNPGSDPAWLTDNANRLARDETGLLNSGGSIAEIQAWAGGLNDRLMQGAMAVPIGSGVNPAETRLAELLSKPLVIEVRTDSDMIMAHVERHTEMQMRRGQ